MTYLMSSAERQGDGFAKAQGVAPPSMGCPTKTGSRVTSGSHHTNCVFPRLSRILRCPAANTCREDQAVLRKGSELLRRCEQLGRSLCGVVVRRCEDGKAL